MSTIMITPGYADAPCIVCGAGQWLECLELCSSRARRSHRRGYALHVEGDLVPVAVTETVEVAAGLALELSLPGDTLEAEGYAWEVDTYHEVRDCLQRRPRVVYDGTTSAAELPFTGEP